MTVMMNDDDETLSMKKRTSLEGIPECETALGEEESFFSPLAGLHSPPLADNYELLRCQWRPRAGRLDCDSNS
ncbi:hypothetical protein H109_01710 [Trichophyton interdigitale MR816]|uniref:Uncharacterized protein n=1 Tax=Trichophyton interdigitale (strain MR816) TaxID=1215338 RepID=A0A059JF42_TRIIM|nr:hypothetical protein H109_01710 [Trichophyton interdigitale MR816]